MGQTAVSHNYQVWVGSALELLQMFIASDAGSDDDRRCNSKLLAGEINRLDSLDAFELIDGERVAIHTAATVLERVRQAALAHCHFWDVRVFLGAAYLRLVS